MERWIVEIMPRIITWKTKHQEILKFASEYSEPAHNTGKQRLCHSVWNIIDDDNK